MTDNPKAFEQVAQTCFGKSAALAFLRRRAADRLTTAVEGFTSGQTLAKI